MKIKCDDGIVRNFTPAQNGDGSPYGGLDSQCNECLTKFGVHDTKVLKPRWKAHVCKRETR